MLWWSQAFLLFSFLLKSENTKFDRFVNISFFFFLFWSSFILFSQPIILRKVCVLEIFLAQSFRRSHYFSLFFQRRPFFWRNYLMQSFYVQFSLLHFPFPYFFLPSFLFISLTTTQDISFQIQLIKNSVLRILIKRVWIW